jgi:hypothetical protein
LGTWRAEYPFSGLAWFFFGGYLAVPAAALAAALGHAGGVLTAMFGVPTLLCVGAGVQTRRRKAVHLFEEGIVVTGMGGQVKLVARWSELTVWIKRTMQRYGTRHAYGVAVGGRERLGFGEKQVQGGPELAAALTAAAAAGHRRALEENGSVTFGAESTADPLGSLRITAEQIHLDQHGVAIPIASISRVWIATVPFRGKGFRILNVTRTTDPVETTMLTFRPADIVAAGELIASLAGMKVELGEAAS